MTGTKSRWSSLSTPGRMVCTRQPLDLVSNPRLFSAGRQSRRNSTVHMRLGPRANFFDPFSFLFPDAAELASVLGAPNDGRAFLVVHESNSHCSSGPVAATWTPGGRSPGQIAFPPPTLGAIPRRSSPGPRFHTARLFRVQKMVNSGTTSADRDGSGTSACEDGNPSSGRNDQRISRGELGVLTGLSAGSHVAPEEDSNPRLSASCRIIELSRRGRKALMFRIVYTPRGGGLALFS